jgi:hypothetical protein
VRGKLRATRRRAGPDEDNREYPECQPAFDEGQQNAERI